MARAETPRAWQPFVRGLRARGIEAQAIDLPTRKAEDALPPSTPWSRPSTMSPSAATRTGAASRASPRRSPTRRTSPLVCFSYPLHPPGAPERTDARIAHWPAIRCPVLLLSGEADPFAQIDLLRGSVSLLANAELVTYPRLGHTLKPVLDDALDRVAAFLGALSVPTD